MEELPDKQMMHVANLIEVLALELRVQAQLPKAERSSQAIDEIAERLNGIDDSEMFPAEPS